MIIRCFSLNYLVVGTLIALSSLTLFLADHGSTYGQDASTVTQRLQPSDVKTVDTLRYDIDRSQVPSLSYNDLTLIVSVGQIESAQVLADGSLISHDYDASAGRLRFTTSAESVELILNNAQGSSDWGNIAKAELKDGKDFAWSIGLDDNVDLKASVNVLDGLGWQGTFFLIAEYIDDNRDEEWIVDAPYLRSKLASGWALGNHTWSHTCDENMISEQDIMDGYNRLLSVVASSSRPDYKITSFAAPCFAPAYHPLILSQRDNSAWPVQFNESGERTPLIVDFGVTEDLYSPEETNPVAYAFDYDLPVGRSTELENLNTQAVIDKIDWMATRHAQFSDHMWYNVIVHGGKDVQINAVASHLYNNYGPGGTDQVWVAPADQIYSYLLVRDRSVVTASSEPVFTPTSTPSPVSTETPASTPTATAMGSSTPTPVPQSSTPIPTGSSTAVLTPTAFVPTSTPTSMQPTATATSLVAISPTAILPSVTLTPTPLSTVEPTAVFVSPTAFFTPSPLPPEPAATATPILQMEPRVHLPLIARGESSD